MSSAQHPCSTHGDVTPIPKPRKREKASRAVWAALHEKFAGQPCVSCGFSIDLELHHVVPRSAGGDDVEANLVPLCHACHMIFEDHAKGWEHVAAHIRSYVWGRTSRLNYVDRKIGRERFDRRYPLPTWLALGDLAAAGLPSSLELPK